MKLKKLKPGDKIYFIDGKGYRIGVKGKDGKMQPFTVTGIKRLPKGTVKNLNLKITNIEPSPGFRFWRFKDFPGIYITNHDPNCSLRKGLCLIYDNIINRQFLIFERVLKDKKFVYRYIQERIIAKQTTP